MKAICSSGSSGIHLKKLNKRLYYFRGTDYSVEAATVAISAKFTF